MIVEAMNETKTRSIGKGYGFYMPIAIGLLVLLLLAYGVIVYLYWDLWNGFFSTSSWWIVVLPPLGAIFYLFIFACILKGADDKRTKQRGTAIHEVCKKVNKDYLSKSDVNVACGDYSAWLEVNYDPTKSKYFSIVHPCLTQN
jgi:hypothetical protein